MADLLYIGGWLFLCFGALGVVVEMVYAFAQEGVIESRLGVLYFPLSPIYAIGGVTISLFLLPYVRQPILLFLAGIVVCTVVEYVASFVMEKAFHAVFWDYSQEPWNLHGRVCLRYSIYWGFLSLALMYIINPAVVALIRMLPRGPGGVLLVVLGSLAGVAILLTLAAFARLRVKVEGRDAGRSIMRNRAGRVVDRVVPDRVLFWTFPRMNLVTAYMESEGIDPMQLRLDLRVPSKQRQALIDGARAVTLPE